MSQFREVRINPAPFQLEVGKGAAPVDDEGEGPGGASEDAPDSPGMSPGYEQVPAEVEAEAEAEVEAEVEEQIVLDPEVKALLDSLVSLVEKRVTVESLSKLGGESLALVRSEQNQALQELFVSLFDRLAGLSAGDAPLERVSLEGEILNLVTGAADRCQGAVEQLLSSLEIDKLSAVTLAQEAAFQLVQAARVRASQVLAASQWIEEDSSEKLQARLQQLLSGKVIDDSFRPSIASERGIKVDQMEREVAVQFSEVLHRVQSMYHAESQKKKSKKFDPSALSAEQLLQRAQELRVRIEQEESERLQSYVEKMRKDEEAMKERTKNLVATAQSQDTDKLRKLRAMDYAEKVKARVSAEEHGRKEIALLLHMSNTMKKDAQKAEQERNLRNDLRTMERNYNLRTIRLLREKEIKLAEDEMIKAGEQKTVELTPQQRIARAVALAQSVRASAELKKAMDRGETVEQARMKFELNLRKEAEERNQAAREFAAAQKQLQLLEAEESEEEEVLEKKLGRSLTAQERRAKMQRRTQRAKARANARKRVAQLQEEQYKRQLEKAKRDAEAHEAEVAARKLAERIARENEEKERRAAELRAEQERRKKQEEQDIRDVMEALIWHAESDERAERDVKLTMQSMVARVEQMDSDRQVREALESVVDILENREISSNVVKLVVEMVSTVERTTLRDEAVSEVISLAIDGAVKIATENERIRHAEMVARREAEEARMAAEERERVRREREQLQSHISEELFADLLGELVTEVAQQEAREAQDEADVVACVQELTQIVELRVNQEKYKAGSVMKMLIDLSESKKRVRDHSMSQMRKYLTRARVRIDARKSAAERRAKTAREEAARKAEMERKEAERREREIAQAAENARIAAELAAKQAAEQERIREEERRRADAEREERERREAEDRKRAADILAALMHNKELAATKQKLERLQSERDVDRKRAVEEAIRRREAEDAEKRREERLRVERQKAELENTQVQQVIDFMVSMVEVEDNVRTSLLREEERRRKADEAEKLRLKQQLEEALSRERKLLEETQRKLAEAQEEARQAAAKALAAAEAKAKADKAKEEETIREAEERRLKEAAAKEAEKEKERKREAEERRLKEAAAKEQQEKERQAKKQKEEQEKARLKAKQEKEKAASSAPAPAAASPAAAAPAPAPAPAPAKKPKKLTKAEQTARLKRHMTITEAKWDKLMTSAQNSEAPVSDILEVTGAGLEVDPDAAVEDDDASADDDWSNHNIYDVNDYKPLELSRKLRLDESAHSLAKPPPVDDGSCSIM